MTDELDKKIDRHYKRMQTFVNEGLSEDDAFDLAEAMWTRDEDEFDDRRLCFECKNYENKKCKAILDKLGRPTQQLRFILQRCDYFVLKGKKPLTDEERNRIDASLQHQERE
jgi:hypothetical protein